MFYCYAGYSMFPANNFTKIYIRVPTLPESIQTWCQFWRWRQWWCHGGFPTQTRSEFWSKFYSTCNWLLNFIWFYITYILWYELITKVHLHVYSNLSIDHWYFRLLLGWIIGLNLLPVSTVRTWCLMTQLKLSVKSTSPWTIPRNLR